MRRACVGLLSLDSFMCFSHERTAVKKNVSAPALTQYVQHQQPNRRNGALDKGILSSMFSSASKSANGAYNQRLTSKLWMLLYDGMMQFSLMLERSWLHFNFQRQGQPPV